MKKIGIATFFAHDNYGALLQAYALKKKINDLGTEVIFLSFDDGKNRYVSGDERAQSSLLIQRILAERKKRVEYFADFRSRYLPAASFYDGMDREYDAFIAGSDQIWNSEITGGDDRYFLSFAPDEKKIAYAASFGRSELDCAEKERMQEKLKDFLPYLSVRENSGAALVREMTGFSAAVCLDPVLLTTETDWKEVVPETDDAEYLLLVMVQNDPVLFQSAKRMAEEKGLILKTVTAAFFPMLGFDPWSRVSVEKWVSLIAGASFVITSSFHGVAFSLIFHIPFCFSPLKGNLAARNSRVTELLSTLSLSDRVSRWDDTIDWESVEALRRSEMEKSMSFLKSALAGRGIL